MVLGTYIHTLLFQIFNHLAPFVVGRLFNLLCMYKILYSSSHLIRVCMLLSIGSLGDGNSEAHVSGVTVNGAKLSGTMNGVRIKTYQVVKYTRHKEMLLSKLNYRYVYFLTVALVLILCREDQEVQAT